MTKSEFGIAAAADGSDCNEITRGHGGEGGAAEGRQDTSGVNEEEDETDVVMPLIS